MSTKDFKKRTKNHKSGFRAKVGSFSKRSEISRIEPSKNKIKIEIINKTSINLPNQHFTNKMKDNNFEDPLNKRVGDLLRMDGKSYLTSEINLDKIVSINYTHPSTGDRITDLFTQLNIPINLETEKADVIPIDRNKNEKKESGDLFRVILNWNITNKEIMIYLLDPHHMVADKNYCEIYENHKDNDFCISTFKSFMY